MWKCGKGQTDTQTDRDRLSWPIYISPWLCLTQNVIITFRASCSRREMYCGQPHLCVCPWRHCMDPDVTWGSGRGCPLVMQYWADLQSGHGSHCYGNTTRMRNVSEYMLVLDLCLVTVITEPESRYSFYDATGGGRLSRPRHCSKGVQPCPRLYIAVAVVINTTACCEIRIRNLSQQSDHCDPQ